MRYIVLDTNCLLQALPSSSPFHKIWTEVLEGHICLCVNTDILEEYEEVLALKTTPEIARNIVDAIAHLSTTIFQNTYVHFELLPADSDDNKFVDCAVASDAEYIVTNDKHFNPLKTIPWPKVEIIKIVDFIKLI
jgi:putative PIN family toxin of toxin-antitoxin system